MQRTKGNNLDSDKILLSVKEASELTGISERKLRDLMNESNFKVQIGRRTMIHRKKFERWISRPSLVINEFSAIFCDLNGATRYPS